MSLAELLKRVSNEWELGLSTKAEVRQYLIEIVQRIDEGKV